MKPTTLLGVTPIGEIREVRNEYEHLRDFVNGLIEFVPVSEADSVIINEEGLLMGLPLNVPVSMMAGRLLCGPALLVGRDVDPFGESVEPSDLGVGLLTALAERWNSVDRSATRLGQDLRWHPVPESVPGPTFHGLTMEEFDRFLQTGEVPDRES